MRVFTGRAIRALLVAVGLLTPLGGAARLAVEVESGRILLEDAADAPRYPASLTKMMTVYLAFEAMEKGEISPDDKVKVSRHAAGQTPVKIGFRVGAELRFGDVLSAAAVASANDAAVVVAEAVAGSEEAFVARMNAAAVRLGLINTRFVNASGLPGAGQSTTARDMALLGAALLREHPKRSELFNQRAGRLAGKSYQTTNTILGFPGGFGLKTGFTCAAGYNVVGAVERGGRKVILVTLGNPSRPARTRDAQDILRKALAATPGAALRPALSRAGAPADLNVCVGAKDPEIRRGTREWGVGVSADTMEIISEEIYRDPDSAVASLGSYRPSASAPEYMLSAPPQGSYEPARPPAPPPLGGWALHLGSEANETAARMLVQQVASAFGAGVPHIEARARDGRWNMVVHGLPDQRTALQIGQRLQTQGRYALVLTPDTLTNASARWRR
ncbi:D-alanyl-D-alanine carboxypeptidase family protein [Neomegalonema sp.]|uniref:D-alanyl-D-alanine carboxypeptidase family protein n=1 Tax=Neomegalonema sp. TaxID=2039713 RepID=UPI00260689FF|nr:D-alanyl-D-alanine carboxypeptidase family protein [Neomegalonema sp.]MDD2868060.1 D-alanyl-D-alanine carboxypeptidase [Neomegalonema sp.]